MEQNKYYLTICDDFNGFMRKTLIYVTEINESAFKFKVADWRANKKEQIVVHIHYPKIETANLKDADCFKKVSENLLIALVTI